MRSNPKIILLTGATGLVGCGISNLIKSKDFRVRAIYNRNKINAENFEWIKIDLTNQAFYLAPILEGVHTVIHNAACLKTGMSQEEILEIKKVNIDFTNYLFNEAGRFNVQKIIFTSSFSMVKKPLPPIIEEGVNLEPLTPYANSKYIGEQILQEISAKYNIRYNILRLSSPVNFNLDVMHETVLKKWIQKSKESKKIQVFGKGSRTQDFVAVSDIAQAFHSCLKEKIPDGIFNIASGNTISMLKLAKMITNKFQNEFEFSGLDENENERWNISIEKAKKYLNYEPMYSSENVINTLLDNY